MDGSVGSNGVITMGNNSSIYRADLGPSATLLGNPEQSMPPMTSPVDFTLPPVPIEGTETANNNAAIPSGAGYAAGNRSLTLNSDLILPAGDYNFCRLKINSGGITAAPGATVRIFIDAPSAVRPASGCPNGNGWGEMEGKNGVSLGQPRRRARRAPDLHPTGGPKTVRTRRSTAAASSTWPRTTSRPTPSSTRRRRSSTSAKNNAIINGGVAAEEIYIKNNLDLTWDSGLDSLGGGQYTRSAWRECRATRAVAADPESGCS